MSWIHEQLRIYGAETLSTHDLITTILSPTASQDDLALIAHVLETYGIRGIAQHLFLQEECSEETSHLLQSILELARRMCLPTADTPCIRSSDDAVNILRPFLVHLNHEEFRVLVLNSKHQVMTNHLLYRGTVNSCAVRTAEVYREAILRKGACILVAHCHPSSCPDPSEEDIEVTHQLVEAGNILDIPLLDHIIIGNPDYVSLHKRLKWTDGFHAGSASDTGR